MTGYSKEEVIGHGWFSRFLGGPGTSPEALRRVHEAAEAGQPLTLRLLNYRKDGSPFWNMLTMTPIRDAEGQLVKIVGVQVGGGGGDGLGGQGCLGGGGLARLGSRREVHARPTVWPAQTGYAGRRQAIRRALLRASVCQDQRELD
jgi:hypothetical protein